MIRALIFDYYGVIRPSGFRLPGKRNDDALLRYIQGLRPKYRVGLLSNIESASRFTELFESYNPNDYFDAILASGDTDYIKPDPQMYRLMAEKLDADPSECVMIDDREDYGEGARTAGMHVLHYTGLQQLHADLAQLTNSQ